MQFLRQIIKDLGTPSSYDSQWYEWVTHHISHTTLSGFINIILCDAYFFGLGQYPTKFVVGIQTVIIFAIYQIFVQRDKENDVLGDFVFWAFGPLFIFSRFSEIEVGSSDLSVSFLNFWLVFITWALFFIPGIIIRIINKDKGNADVYK